VTLSLLYPGVGMGGGAAVVIEVDERGTRSDASYVYAGLYPDTVLYPDTILVPEGVLVLRGMRGTASGVGDPYDPYEDATPVGSRSNVGTAIEVP
jgi:hypothetical protein